MISRTDFQTNFPPSVEIPYLLARLLEYQNKVNDFYSGHFELTAYGADDVVSWFDGDTETALKFTPFGHGILPNESSSIMPSARLLVKCPRPFFLRPSPIVEFKPSLC